MCEVHPFLLGSAQVNWDLIALISFYDSEKKHTDCSITLTAAI